MSYIKMADEKVTAVLLCDDGKNMFYHITDGFQSNPDVGLFDKKSNVFDAICKEPNVEEIESRIVYLNPSELQELLTD